MIDTTRGALLTDLYQLTMLQGYVRQGLEDTAVGLDRNAEVR